MREDERKLRLTRGRRGGNSRETRGRRREFGFFGRGRFFGGGRFIGEGTGLKEIGHRGEVWGERWGESGDFLRRSSPRGESDHVVKIALNIVFFFCQTVNRDTPFREEEIEFFKRVFHEI
jgi:hypothetical protein